jgi:hypothetical protein
MKPTDFVTLSVSAEGEPNATYVSVVPGTVTAGDVENVVRDVWQLVPTVAYRLREAHSGRFLAPDTVLAGTLRPGVTELTLVPSGTVDYARPAASRLHIRLPSGRTAVVDVDDASVTAGDLASQLAVTDGLDSDDVVLLTDDNGWLPPMYPLSLVDRLGSEDLRLATIGNDSSYDDAGGGIPPDATLPGSRTGQTKAEPAAVTASDLDASSVPSEPSVAGGQARGIALDAWIPRLPHPMSASLWRYHASTSPHERLAHLLAFFEGTAQFIAIVLASGMGSVYQPMRPRSDSRFLVATFGAWVKAIERLATVLQGVLSQSDGHRNVAAAFGTASVREPSTLIDERLLRALRAAVRIRNLAAHESDRGSATTLGRLVELETLLPDIENSIRGTFDDWRLIQAQSGMFRSGRYSYDVDILEGAYAGVRRTNIVVSVPLDVDTLYMLDPNVAAPMALLPLIRHQRLLGMPATYLYSRCEGRDARFICHHLDGVTPVIVPKALVYPSIGVFDQVTAN